MTTKMMKASNLYFNLRGFNFNIENRLYENTSKDIKTIHAKQVLLRRNK